MISWCEYERECECVLLIVVLSILKTTWCAYGEGTAASTIGGMNKDGRSDKRQREIEISNCKSKSKSNKTSAKRESRSNWLFFFVRCILCPPRPVQTSEAQRETHRHHSATAEIKAPLISCGHSLPSLPFPLITNSPTPALAFLQLREKGVERET